MATIRKPAAVSMDPDLFDRAKSRAKALGFPTFSAYVSQLIRADIISNGNMNVLAESPAVYHGQSSTTTNTSISHE